MVRTKADSCPAAGRKVVAASAPRKSLGASSSAGSSSSTSSPSANKYAGGNPVCPRPTPEWQRGINSFFTKKPGKENKGPEEEPGCSASLSDSAVCEPSNTGGSSSESCASSSSATTGAKAKKKKRVSRIDSSEEDE